MVNWRIGCSGFHYKHWKEIFYPPKLPQNKWFDFYCQHFDTLELNVTFYRFPQLSFLQTWHKRSPGNFSFSVKAPRAITHFKKFTGTEALLSSFYLTIKEGLQEKLGCVLFQFPPQSSYTVERLDRIISSLDSSFANVLEFRHASWWDKNVYRELAKHNISFCGMSHPALPAEIIQNNRILYYRFHGVPELYKSKYDFPVLKHFVDEVERSETTKKSFIYFNNDIAGSAIDNAKEMNRYCGSLK